MASLLRQYVGVVAPDWPDWAVNTFLGLSVSCMALVGGQNLSQRGQLKQTQTRVNGGNGSAKGQAKAFKRFQVKYLSVYFVVMLADWLQGTNMYTLYQSYGVDVGLLFLTGFSSAAVFGTFLGLFVDKFGRRAGCMVFCVLELVINLLEHFPSMGLLITGRILGGISTSLLFSAFESWMVSEHRKKGFPEELLESTFSLATVGNGIMAVLAGVAAQISADALGDIGPFQVAIALTALALALLFSWEENYGHESHGNTGPKVAAAGDSKGNGHSNGAANGHANGHSSGDGADGSGSSKRGLGESVSLAVRCITSDPRVLLLGLVQSLFEGGMYTFVFMWVPTMQGVVPGGNLPTGLVFSAFMVCVAMGGLLFSQMLRCLTVEMASAAVFLLAAIAMAMPVVAAHDFTTVLGSFLVLETCVGAFYSCSGLMRSKYLPDDLQSSIMNLFRLPLNLLVVVGTRLTDVAAPATVFLVVSLWFAATAALQLRLCAVQAQWGEGSPGHTAAAATNGKGKKD